MAVLSKQNFNLKLLFFEERGRPENPANNLSGAKEITNNKLNPHMASTPGVEPRPHWREVSALTTAPPLLPNWVRIFCMLQLWFPKDLIDKIQVFSLNTIF